MRYLFFIFTGILLNVSCYAFPCVITAVKDSCWTNYNVTINVVEASDNNQQLAKVIIPAGTSWAREKFACEPKQQLKFVASFSPVFWESDQGKSYLGKRYWILPEKIQSNETAWELTVCFPEQFAQVPLPPDASGNCQCSLQDIPPIKP